MVDGERVTAVKELREAAASNNGLPGEGTAQRWYSSSMICA